MASPGDNILNSDAVFGATPSSRLQNDFPSSSRPRPPPSESAGLPSEADLFPDDAIVGAARGRGRNPLDRNVPPVVDRAGEGVQAAFESFLEAHIEEPPASGIPQSSELKTDRYYVNQIHALKEFGLSTLYVDYRHLLASKEGNVLSNAIAGHYYRFLPYLTKALHNLLQKYEPTYFKDHRQMGASNTSQAGTSVAGAATSEWGSQGDRTTNQQTDKVFTIAFYNLPLVSRVRQLRTDQIGKLVSISGTVTRTSEVRPELALGTFICEACNTTVPNVEQTFRYTEPAICPNATCMNKEGWRLDLRNSTFVDWQRCRVQENSSEIPTGSMPRTMDIILRGEQVERTKPGEKCIFTGTLIAVPDVSQLGIPGVKPESSKDNRNFRGGEAGGAGVSGLKALGVRDLTYRMAFLACFSCPDITTPGQPANALTGQSTNILSSLNQVDLVDTYGSGASAQEAYLETLSPAEIDDLKLMVHTDKIYSRLTNSLAPTVYGHEIVKKGLLLQLLGGVSKKTPEGMPLRGDINICIVGDPSTSKSQFLKYISSFLPRAVYTSGKASSAAGLTAAVVKDEETGEHTIEAGALMLSDSGTCCIDEFDKMDIADQVAIHEAMEQQTISIAKAGIHATLNARTSILAAANPIGGRYNRKTTLRANINMSAPIMSRFDLFFVVLDECNESVDRHLASHIVNLHMNRDEAVKPEFSTEQLQRYIRFARTFKPKFSPEAKDLLVTKYKELRANDSGGIGRNSYRITVRQLESLIRLSEAIAKANCVEDISTEFVYEAFDLLQQSIITVERDDVEVDDEPAAAAAATADGDEADAPMADGEDAPATDDQQQQQQQQQQQPTVRRQKITWEKFSRMQNMLAGKIRDDEEQHGIGPSREELTLWYLEQIEEELGSESQIEEERELCRKVLRRMVKENVILEIRGEGLRDDDDDAAAAAEEEDGEVKISYALHPNCGIFDDE